MPALAPFFKAGCLYKESKSGKEKQVWMGSPSAFPSWKKESSAGAGFKRSAAGRLRIYGWVHGGRIVMLDVYAYCSSSFCFFLRRPRNVRTVPPAPPIIAIRETIRSAAWPIAVLADLELLEEEVLESDDPSFFKEVLDDELEELDESGLSGLSGLFGSSGLSIFSCSSAWLIRWHTIPGSIEKVMDVPSADFVKAIGVDSPFPTDRSLSSVPSFRISSGSAMVTSIA